MKNVQKARRLREFKCEHAPRVQQRPDDQF
jgi:hypothetical protein